MNRQPGVSDRRGRGPLSTLGGLFTVQLDVLSVNVGAGPLTVTTAPSTTRDRAVTLRGLTSAWLVTCLGSRGAPW